MKNLKNFINEIDEVKINALEGRTVKIERSAKDIELEVAAAEFNRFNNSILALLINKEAQIYNKTVSQNVKRTLKKLKESNQVFTCLLNDEATVWAKSPFADVYKKEFIHNVQHDLGGYVIVEIFDPLMQNIPFISDFEYESGFEILQKNTHGSSQELIEGIQNGLRDAFADILGQDYETALEIEKCYADMLVNLDIVSHAEADVKFALDRVAEARIKADEAESKCRQAKKENPDLFALEEDDEVYDRNN